MLTCGFPEGWTDDSRRLKARRSPSAVSTVGSFAGFDRPMYCQSCGKELSPGASSCRACGARVFFPPSSTQPADQVDQIAAEMKRAAKELASSAAQLSQRLAVKAEAAAKDPSGSAKKAAHRVAAELDAVAKDVDRILRDL